MQNVVDQSKEQPGYIRKASLNAMKQSKDQFELHCCFVKNK